MAIANGAAGYHCQRGRGAAGRRPMKPRSITFLVALSGSWIGGVGSGLLGRGGRRIAAVCVNTDQPGAVFQRLRHSFHGPTLTCKSSSPTLNRSDP
jgi:hypothetical protein